MTFKGLRPSRRDVLRTTTAAAAAGLFAPALVNEVNAQSTFNWRRFAGTRIDVLLVRNPRSDLLQAHEREFTELTGIQVSSEQVPEQQQRQKAMIEFTSGRPTFDAVMLALHVQKRLAARGRWLEDLRPFIADGSLTSPDFDFNDFAAGAVNFARQADGTLDTLPHFIDFWMLYYNKELFAQRGVEYPKTIDEMVTAAQRLNDPSRQIAGFVSRGLRNANVPVWTSYLLGQGLETVSSTGQLQTDGPEAIWAGEIYKRLNREFAPPGTVGFNWNECQTTFMQGRAAMWLDGIGFATPLEDPTRSRIVGKVGYGVMPAGPKAHHSGLFGDGMGISRASTKKQATWLYLQFMCNKGNQLAMLRAGAGAPGRSSSHNDPRAREGSRFSPEYFECLAKSGQIARAGLPQIIPVTEFRDTFGTALTNTISGADVATELRRATEAFRPVLERSEQG